MFHLLSGLLLIGGIVCLIPAQIQAKEGKTGTITGVHFHGKGNSIQVVIEGMQIPTPRVFTLKGPRLVLDFPGSNLSVGTPRISVDHFLLKRIRMGRHTDPPRIRLVMDLQQPVDYEFRHLGGKVLLDILQSNPEGPEKMRETVQTSGSHAIRDSRVLTVGSQSGKKKQNHWIVPVSGQGREIPVQASDSRVSPPQAGGVEEKYQGSPISLDMQDAEISHVLRILAEVSGLNIVLGEDVRGTLTLKLDEVPWDQVFDILLKTQGLGKVQEGNIVRVDTHANIARGQEAEAKTKASLVKSEDLLTRIIWINYSRASILSRTLRKNLSARGEMTVDDATNALIVKDVPQNLDEISRLAKILDRQTPQILIESRIVQANTSFARDLGIQWGGKISQISSDHILSVAGTNGDPAFGAADPNFVVNLPASGSAGPMGQIGLTFGKFTGNPLNLDLRLSAGEARGETKLLSNPRIFTLDNKEAMIQQGDSIPFETISQNGTQTQFIDALLNLTVTPHATSDGSIIMKIKVAKNAIGSFRSQGGAPSINKSELMTEVLVRSGETVVIGGILETEKSTSNAGVPMFHKLPVLGWFFKKESQVNSHKELLIFITPTIITDRTAQQLIVAPDPD